MDSNLLTIVILSRDRPEFLEKCLRSAFEKQTVVPNVIVSDNSTEDHSAIRKHRSAYPIHLRPPVRASEHDGTP